MEGEKKNGSHAWMGHPMASYIGAPLQAVIESSIMSVKSTAEFIEEVGTKTTKDGKIVPRNIPFFYNRTGYDQKTGESYAEKVRVEIPLISLVKVPNIEIHKIDYSFSLEIKSVTDSSLSNKTGKRLSEFQNPRSPMPKLYGVISAPHTHTRRTNTSTKMQLDVQAEKSETTEGMARIMDLMNQSITPHTTERAPLSAEISEDDHLPDFDIDDLSDTDIQKLFERLKRYNSD